jgi:hypothetical protein
MVSCGTVFLQSFSPSHLYILEYVASFYHWSEVKLDFSNKSKVRTKMQCNKKIM